jgi:hypothetical protein
LIPAIIDRDKGIDSLWVCNPWLGAREENKQTNKTETGYFQFEGGSWGKKLPTIRAGLNSSQLHAQERQKNSVSLTQNMGLTIYGHPFEW